MIDDLDMSDGLRAHFKALRRSDPALNLDERLEFFQDYNPEFAEARFGFVPMVAEHGWAVWTAPDVDFAYTLGLDYSLGHPDLMLVMPGSGITERDAALRALLASVMVDVPAGTDLPSAAIEVEGVGPLALRPYDGTHDFEARPNGLLHSFMRFFADVDTDVQPPRMWIAGAPKRAGLLRRFFGRR